MKIPVVEIIYNSAHCPNNHITKISNSNWQYYYIIIHREEKHIRKDYYA